jgi:hypothetical protein
MKQWIVILLCVQGVFAQVTFEATTARQSVAQNERLRVDFTINEAGKNFSPPTFDGFKIVAGPYKAVKVDYVKGQQTYKRTYKYFLIPERQGEMTIRQATIEFEGKTYKTEPIVIMITAPVKEPANEMAPEQPKKHRWQKRL